MTGITGSDWTTQPIGDVTVTGNTFTDNAYQIIARGSDYANPVGYWTGFLANNTFDKAVLTLTPDGDARTNSYERLGWVNALTDPSKNVHFRMIGTDIQESITRATAGDTIKVGAGEYTTTGQVLIDKNLAITGVDGKPVISPATDLTATNNVAGAWFLVNAGVTFNLSNIVLDGNGKKVQQAVRSHGTTSITNVDFANIVNSTNPYVGFAVANFGGTIPAGAGSDTHGSGGVASMLTLTESTFTNIGRVGVLTKGTGSTATLTGNTYTGKEGGDFLDYAFEFGAGGSGTVSGNTISGNRGASSDGSTSAGILVTEYYGSGTNAIITGNTFSNNTAALHVGYLDTDASVVVAHDNDFSGETMGVESDATTITVNAANNWWGTASSTEIAIKISGDVDYTPWYINPGRTVLNTAISSGGGGGGTITTTEPTIDFEETTNGGVSLPDGTSNLILGNDSVLDFASSTNPISQGMGGGEGLVDGIVIAGDFQPLSSFDSGDMDNVDLTEPLDIGGEDVLVEQAVQLSSGTEGEDIVLTNSELPDVSVSIPDGTTILASNDWDGTIMPPTDAPSEGTAPSGFSVGDTVIEVGSPDVVLLFDQAVKITLTGVTGTVGYKPAGSNDWKNITTQCTSADDHSNIAFPDECYFTDGADTVIWTYHFTEFGGMTPVAPTISPNGGMFSGLVDVTMSNSSGLPIRYTTNGSAPTCDSTLYSATFSVQSGSTVKAVSCDGTNASAIASAAFTTPLPSGGGSGGNPPPPATSATSATPATPTVTAATPATPATPAVTTTTTTTGQGGQVLGAAVYFFANNLTVGSRGADVTALQQFLTGASLYTGPITGYFGQLTKAAVISFQKARGITPAVGYVGPLTRAELNKGGILATGPSSSNLTAEQVSSIVAVLNAFGLDQATMDKVRAALGQ